MSLEDLRTQWLKGFSRSTRHANAMVFRAIQGFPADIPFHGTVETDQRVALVDISTTHCRLNGENRGMTQLIWIDLDWFWSFPWIRRQTNLDSTWHIWRSASFPQISQEKAFLDLGMWFFASLCHGRNSSEDPGLSCWSTACLYGLVANPGPATWLPWLPWLGLAALGLRSRLWGSSQTSPWISTSRHSSVKLQRRQGWSDLTWHSTGSPFLFKLQLIAVFEWKNEWKNDLIFDLKAQKTSGGMSDG